MKIQPILFFAAIIIALASPVMGQGTRAPTRFRVLFDGQPVVGAPVLVFLNADRGVRTEFQEALDLDFASFRARAQLKTDDSGEVQLGPCPRGALAIAWLGDQVGAARAFFDDGEVHDLVMEPDHNTTVQIVDSEDRPVADLHAYIFDRKVRWGGFTRPFRTDSSGSFLVRHSHLGFQTDAGAVYPLRPEDRQHRGVGMNALAKDQAVDFAIDAAKAMPEHLVIKLTEVGLIEIRGVDQAGEGSARSFQLEAASRDFNVGSLEYIDVDGGTRTVPIAPGTRATLSFLERFWRPSDLTKITPLVAGERRRVTIQLSEEEELQPYSLRLLGPEGEPLTSGRGEAQMRMALPKGLRNPRSHETLPLGFLECAADGMTLLPALSYFADLFESQNLKLLDLEVKIATEVGPMQGAINLPESLPKSDLHLGDLRLAAIPYAVSGVLLDVEGSPIERAYIRLYDPNEDAGGTSSDDRRSLGYAVTDEQGRFFVVAPDPGHSVFNLGTEASGFADTLIRAVKRNGPPLKIVASRQTILVLHLPGWEKLYQDNLPFDLVREKDSAADPSASNETTKSSGPQRRDARLWATIHGLDQCVWSDLRPGNYRIEYRKQVGAKPIPVIENILVKAARVTRRELSIDVAKERGLVDEVAKPRETGLLKLTFDDGENRYEEASVRLFPRAATTEDLRAAWSQRTFGAQISCSLPIPAMVGLAFNHSGSLTSFFVTKGGQENEVVAVTKPRHLRFVGREAISSAEQSSLRAVVSMLECDDPKFADLPINVLFKREAIGAQGLSEGVSLPGAGRYRIQFIYVDGSFNRHELSSHDLELKAGESEPIEFSVPQDEELKEALKRRQDEQR